MKLKEFKKVIDKCVKNAKSTNPDIEFYFGETQLYLDEVGQFGIMPDVVITLKEDK